MENLNEWELSIRQEEALKQEDFETCSLIQKEIDRRIKNGTINKALMNGFKYWNPKTKKFEGEMKLPDVNGLFNKY
tara:strand:+ start:463 stop:690 length:228 start_codon:yes stop_codon:yes gene_type:complete